MLHPFFFFLFFWSTGAVMHISLNTMVTVAGVLALGKVGPESKSLGASPSPSSPTIFHHQGENSAQLCLTYLSCIGFNRRASSRMGLQWESSKELCAGSHVQWDPQFSGGLVGDNPQAWICILTSARVSVAFGVTCKGSSGIYCQKFK